DPGHRCMPRPAAHVDAERSGHLLRRSADVVAAARELDALAGSFVDREVAADGVGMLAAEPREAEVVADLLVGGRSEDQVAGRLEALTRERGDRDRARRDLALHVERAAAPDLVVADLAGER